LPSRGERRYGEKKKKNAVGLARRCKAPRGANQKKNIVKMMEFEEGTSAANERQKGGQKGKKNSPNFLSNCGSGWAAKVMGNGVCVAEKGGEWERYPRRKRRGERGAHFAGKGWGGREGQGLHQRKTVRLQLNQGTGGVLAEEGRLRIESKKKKGEGKGI